MCSKSPPGLEAWILAVARGVLELFSLRSKSWATEGARKIECSWNQIWNTKRGHSHICLSWCSRPFLAYHIVTVLTNKTLQPLLGTILINTKTPIYWGVSRSKLRGSLWKILSDNRVDRIGTGQVGWKLLRSGDATTCHQLCWGRLRVHPLKIFSLILSSPLSLLFGSSFSSPPSLLKSTSIGEKTEVKTGRHIFSKGD